jgi:hypothetical protein
MAAEEISEETAKEIAAAHSEGDTDLKITGIGATVIVWLGFRSSSPPSFISYSDGRFLPSKACL